MQQTSHYQLNQWDAEDRIQRTDFNSDNAKVDAVLAEQAADLSAQAVKLAKCGNCQLYYTTYTGTGSGSNEFTFPHKPLFICVFGENSYFFAVQGAPYGTGRNGGTGCGISYTTWTGTSVSWVSNNNEPAFQCNVSGMTYYRVVLMDAGE